VRYVRAVIVCGCALVVVEIKDVVVESVEEIIEVVEAFEVVSNVVTNDEVLEAGTDVNEEVEEYADNVLCTDEVGDVVIVVI
jgi:hypothetical protein